jgi:hypothetical protein
MFDVDIDESKSNRSETARPPTAATMSWVEMTVKQAAPWPRAETNALA